MCRFYGNRTGVNEGVLLAHLNVHGQVDGAYPEDGQLSILAADVLADFSGHGLVAALGLDLTERFAGNQLRSQ